MKSNEIEPISDFDYSQLGENETKVRACATTIKNSNKNIALSLIQIGEALIQAKEAIPHGLWLSFLTHETPYKETDAKECMRVAREFKSADSAVLEKFGSSAIKLLSAPSTPEAAREEAKERAAAGEKIGHKEAKEIKEKHAPANRNTRNKAPRSKPSDDTIDGEEIIERDHDDDDEPLTDVCEELVAGKNCGVIKGTKWGMEVWTRFHPDWSKDKILSELRMAQLHIHSVAAAALKKHYPTWEDGAQAALDLLLESITVMSQDPDRW